MQYNHLMISHETFSKPAVFGRNKTHGGVRVVEVVSAVPPGALIEQRAARVPPLVRVDGGRERRDLGHVESEGIVAC